MWPDKPSFTRDAAMTLTLEQEERIQNAKEAIAASELDQEQCLEVAICLMMMDVLLGEMV